MNVHPRSVRLTAVFVVAALAGLLAGCSPSTPTAAPTPTPAESGPSVLALRATREALPAGRYTYAGFEPEITLALDGSWQAAHLLPRYFDLDFVPDGSDVTVQFAMPSMIFAGGNSVADATSPAAAVATLQSNLGLRVIETSASQMDGRDGAQVTIETSTTTTWGVMLNSSRSVELASGRRLWIAFFDTSHGLLAIMVGGTVQQWDAALLAAEPVLESVTIGD